METEEATSQQKRKKRKSQMMQPEKKAALRWARGQIRQYKQVFDTYDLYAKTLQDILQIAAKKYAPLAIVQARPKSIASFGEKIWRKKAKYHDPIHQITDLCGARVITHTRLEVDAMCQFIKNHFDVDWSNSLDACQRLRPSEFGYRSVQYIVEVRPGVFPTEQVNVRISHRILGLKAEIQVRTVLEHAWADFCHNRSYKSMFRIPEKWERELAAVAASLEAADNTFSRIEKGLQAYAASYDTYMTKDEIRDEIGKLEIVSEYDRGNLQLAHRIATLAKTLGEWSKVIEVLSRYAKSDYEPILRDLGVAICKRNKENKMSSEYRKGQEYLERATEPPCIDNDAFASLAGTWEGINEDKARELYRRAFEIDPSDPYSLSNFLEYEVIHRRDLSIIPLVRHYIENSLRRCREQADVGMNLPWAFYDMGKFYLLLGRPSESLVAHAKAIQISVEQNADWMIDTSLAGIRKLATMRDQMLGYEWIHRLLLVGLASKFPAVPCGESALGELKKLVSNENKSIGGPVLILTGGRDSSVEKQTQVFGDLLLKIFEDFEGTIICDGVTSRVSGIVGEAQEQYPDSLHTIGYIPRILPVGTATDKRYHEIRHFEGNDFSPMGSLQRWTDLITSGIDPSDVRLLGFDEDAISATEYRIALALGAHVAIVQESESEAAKLFSDIDWKASKMLVQLPADPMTIGAFVRPRVPKLARKKREMIAKAIHEAYRVAREHARAGEEPSLAKWEDLSCNLKESNRQQADHIAMKLHKIHCDIRRATGRDVSLIEFTDDEIELMAETEHARYNVERLLDGWKWGEKKDVTKKTNPSLVPWSGLPDYDRNLDRETVREMPIFLARMGLEIYRKKQNRSRKHQRSEQARA